MITVTFVLGYLLAWAVRRRCPALFHAVRLTARFGLAVLALVLALVALTASLAAGPGWRSGYR